MLDKRFLVVIETHRVKGYLFSSPILRETRGASLILDRLNRSETEKLLETTSAEKVYLGGGSGRILFSDKEDAEVFANRVRERYERATGNARVSVQVVERRDRESFPDWMARGVRESQSNKLARTEAVPLLAGRWIRPCSSCGKEPANTIPPPDVQGTHHLCTSCLYKREEVSQFYHNVKRNWDISRPLPPLNKLKVDWPHFILTTLAENVRNESGKEEKIFLPQDFNQIAERSRPHNYIGFIYADGNRMGETIKHMGTKFPDDKTAQEAYTAFSSIVDQATREAAVQAVREKVGIYKAMTAKNEPGCLVPAEFILAAGDDLILVVPAHTALGVAARFISLFQARTKELQHEWVEKGGLIFPFAPQGLTTSAGVVLAHASYPASQLLDMAAELMKFAKRKAADLAEKKSEEGTLDFVVLHTPGSERIKERRKSEYTRSVHSHKIILTERPYTVIETLKLLERIQALKDSEVPHTKLKALYPTIFQGVLQAQFDALRIKERLQATGALQKSIPLQDLVRELHFFPFRRDDQGRWTTPLSELIELYDFVPRDNANPSPGVTYG